MTRGACSAALSAAISEEESGSNQRAARQGEKPPILRSALQKQVVGRGRGSGLLQTGQTPGRGGEGRGRNWLSGTWRKQKHAHPHCGATSFPSARHPCGDACGSRYYVYRRHCRKNAHLCRSAATKLSDFHSLKRPTQIKMDLHWNFREKKKKSPLISQIKSRCDDGLNRRVSPKRLFSIQHHVLVKMLICFEQPWIINFVGFFSSF